jgi:hypothetical protein
MFFLAGTDTDVFFPLKFRVGKTAEPGAGAGNRLMKARQPLGITLKGVMDAVGPSAALAIAAWLRDEARASCRQCAGSANRNGANHVARNEGIVATITRPKYWT